MSVTQIKLNGKWQPVAQAIAISSTGSTGANWAENNPSMPGYIKNRTHYFEAGAKEAIVYEKALQGESFGGPTGTAYVDASQTSIPFSEADLPVMVYINQTPYEITRIVDGLYTTAENKYPNVYIGLNQAGGEGVLWNGFFVEIWEWPGDATIKIVIPGSEAVYHQLDERFIPDTIARVSDITENSSGLILKSTNYGPTLPASGVEGQVFFLEADG